MTSRERRGELTNGSQPQRNLSSIRPAYWADLFALRRLRGETARLDMPEGVVAGLRPTVTALYGMIPWLGQVRTFVYTVDGHPRALVQANPSRTAHTWDVRYLAYGRKDRIGSAEARDHMWAALLDAVTRVAGKRRATRLFARVPESADALLALRAAGYMPYGGEMLFVAPYHRTKPEADITEMPLHRQQASDTWAIHQLYTLTTPKAQQFAEARTSGYWDLPPRGATQAAYWVGEPHEIHAYARLLSGEHSHLVEVLYRPDAGVPLGPFVRRVIAALPAGEGDLIYCRVLGFQEDLGGALESLGFSLLTRQTLLVKYTVVPVRDLAPVPVWGWSVRYRRAKVAVPTHIGVRQPARGHGTTVSVRKITAAPVLLPARLRAVRRVSLPDVVSAVSAVSACVVRLWHRITLRPTWRSGDA